MQDRVGKFLAGLLSSRKDEVRRRCRTVLQSRAETLPPDSRPDSQHPANAHPILALVQYYTALLLVIVIVDVGSDFVALWPDVAVHWDQDSTKSAERFGVHIRRVSRWHTSVIVNVQKFHSADRESW